MVTEIYNRYKKLPTILLAYEMGYKYVYNGNTNINFSQTFTAPKGGTFFMVLAIDGRTNDNRHDYNEVYASINGCEYEQISYSFINTHVTSAYSGFSAVYTFIIDTQYKQDIIVSIKSPVVSNYVNVTLYE